MGQASSLEGRKRRSFVPSTRGDTVELVATRRWGCQQGSKGDRTDARGMGHRGPGASPEQVIFQELGKQGKRISAGLFGLGFFPP